MSLDKLDRTLALAAKAVDDAAASIAEEGLEPVKDNISKLGQALGLIFDVQRALYSIRPDLEPEVLRERSPYPPGESHVYGEHLLKSLELVERGEIREAIELWRSYLAGQVHPFFREMAEEQLGHLERREPCA
jgi:hypothetical protein